MAFLSSKNMDMGTEGQDMGMGILMDKDTDMTKTPMNLLVKRKTASLISL